MFFDVNTIASFVNTPYKVDWGQRVLQAYYVTAGVLVYVTVTVGLAALISRRAGRARQALSPANAA